MPVSARGVFFLLSVLTFRPNQAGTYIALEGESFIMECYDPNFKDDNFVELKFTPNGLTDQKRIAKYQLSAKTPRFFDSSYEDRLSFSPENSFTLKNVNLDDDGRYECQTFGFQVNDEIIKDSVLEVQVKPSVSLNPSDQPLLEGSGPTLAAECIASDAKPPAKVYWSSSRHLLFNQTNGTVAGSRPSTETSRALLTVSPNKFYNGQPFSCVVEHPTFAENVEVTVINLNVNYPPSIPVIRVINSNTQLNCSSDGNPHPTITWMMPNGNAAPAPSSGHSVIRIISPNSPERQNDTYVCKAENGIGEQTQTSITTAEAVEYKEIVKTSNTGLIVGVVIGTVLLLAVIVALVYWFFVRKQREKDSGPYNPSKIVRHTDDDEGGWSRSSGRPMIQHANESLNKNAPPSPTQPPPADEDDDEGSHYSQSDVEEFTEGHDVDLNSPQTGDDDDDMPATGIISKNSVNFQHRRQRPSTSPHRRSQNRSQPQPSSSTQERSDPHYEVPPKDYYEDDYAQEDRHLIDQPNQYEDQMDDRFYDRPEDRYPGYQPRYDEPPHDEHLPPYSDTVQYASLDHTYDSGKPRTRPPYQEPVEYAEIRSKGQIV